MIHIKFDGACNNHIKEGLRPMGIGVAVFFDDEYIPEESIAVLVEPKVVNGTNNIAEWEGCYEAWKKVWELEDKYPGNPIRMYSDSLIIANQFNGEYGINEVTFQPYYDLTIAMQANSKSNKNLKIEWVKREFNKEADKLSKNGLQGLGSKRCEMTYEHF